MKSKTLLFILLTGLIMIVFSSGDALAKKNACGKEMTAEEMAERALDKMEIQNVMGLHQVYGAPGGDHKKELDLIWAHKTDEVSFAGNGYIVQGPIDVIYKFYAPSEDTGHIQEATGGNLSFRTLTTPIIEVAGDGKTAKAWWYTPGFSAAIQDGKGSSMWSYEKYAIDFVKEDGKWKIWHFHVYNDWGSPMGEDLAEYVIEQEKNKKEMGSREQDEEIAPYYKEIKFGESYSSTRPPNPTNPRPPEPYCTFSDTFSYADE